MNLDDLDITKLMNRLSEVERYDIGERLSYIEKQLKFFVYAATEMKDKFVKGIAVNIDQSSVNVATEIRSEMTICFNLIKDEAKAIRAIRTEIEIERRQMLEMLKSESITGAIKFMAKQLSELTEYIKSIQEDGIKKNIQLDLTLDGYEMVKRKPPKIDEEIQKVDPEIYILNLLNTLTSREKNVLIHRYGLLGQKAKTLEATGKILGTTREQVRQIQMKALRTCRSKSRRGLAEDLTHKELRFAIIGE